MTVLMVTIGILAPIFIGAQFWDKISPIFGWAIKRPYRLIIVISAVIFIIALCVYACLALIS